MDGWTKWTGHEEYASYGPLRIRDGVRDESVGVGHDAREGKTATERTHLGGPDPADGHGPLMTHVVYSDAQFRPCDLETWPLRNMPCCHRSVAMSIAVGKKLQSVSICRRVSTLLSNCRHISTVSKRLESSADRPGPRTVADSLPCVTTMRPKRHYIR